MQLAAVMQHLAVSAPIPESVAAPPPLQLNLMQMSAVVQQLARDHSALVSSKKEAEILRQVSQFTNPLFKRFVESILRLMDATERVVNILSWGGPWCRPTPRTLLTSTPCSP